MIGPIIAGAFVILVYWLGHHRGKQSAPDYLAWKAEYDRLQARLADLQREIAAHPEALLAAFEKGKVAQAEADTLARSEAGFRGAETRRTRKQRVVPDAEGGL